MKIRESHKEKAREDLFSSESAASTVIAAVLLLSIIFALFAVIRIAYVPEWKNDAEQLHMSEVQRDMTELKSTADMITLLQSSNSNSTPNNFPLIIPPVTVPISMGGGEMPVLDPSKSSGSLSINTEPCNVTITPKDRKSIPINSGTITYRSNNRQYVDQVFRYENGAVILAQGDKSIMTQFPSLFNINRTSENNYSILIQTIKLSGNSDTISSDTDTSLRLTGTQCNITELETTNSFYYNITTKYSHAWKSYFKGNLNEIAKRAGLNYGTDLVLDQNDYPDHVCLIFLPGQNNYTLSIRDSIITAEIGAKNGFNYASGELPVAKFDTSINIGYVPLSVQFNDNSLNATEWNWDFGDGTNSNEQNPTHTYINAGYYKVSLIARNEYGTNSISSTVSVLKYTDPKPNFSTNLNDSDGYAPLSVQFNDNSENATGWYWDFGDGFNSTEQNPEHTYSTVGIYTVNLTVSNPNGIVSKLATISVLEKTTLVFPEANFSTNVTSGYAPLSIQFNDSSENETGWNWNFGDGSNSTEQNPIHTYSVAGNYTVNLTVSNAIGIVSKLATITVLEKPTPVLPVANFNTNVTSGFAPLSVQFIDGSDNATGWSWDFNNDGTPESTEVNPVYVFENSGTYTVNLTVSNENGKDSKLATINVSEQSILVLPVANFSTNVTSGYAPLSVQFNDSSENANGCNWDFGDWNTSTEQNPLHLYSAAGNYTVNLTVYNGDNIDLKSVTINVLEQPPLILPVANFSTNVTSGYKPLSVQFNDSSENATGWNWDFGDGINSNEQNPEHTYVVAGIYAVNLTVSNGNGTNSKLAIINVNKTTPTINWNNPPNITFGTALSSSQLNPTTTDPVTGSNVDGNFTYNPGNGTVLSAGNNQTLHVEFTPSDITNYTTASKDVNINISQAIPTITWSIPADIIYGTALNSIQLNATATVSGNFSYTPGNGTNLSAGSNQTLRVVFTPNDNTNYTTASKNVTINVIRAIPTIIWSNPANITYGTALSSTQLNAMASIDGTFVYTPDNGTVLSANTQTLHVEFTPTDATNYTSTSKDVTINISRATPTINWSNPANITYGTPLSNTQLNGFATNVTGSNVTGNFTYTPGNGTVLSAGTQTLHVDFTPTDALNYTNTSKDVNINVSHAIPTITWSIPADIIYGTALNSIQLNATATVSGNFSYTPGNGTNLSAGSNQTLRVVFTPNDNTNYTTASKNVTINVIRAIPTIIWSNPANITYGTALSSTQLNAMASIDGTLIYTPNNGTKLSAGTHTLHVDFTPTDATNYTNASKNVTINVNVLKAYAYITNSLSQNISVIDTETNTVNATITSTFNSPKGVAVNPDGTKVYVTDEQTGKVSVINTATNIVTDTIDVGNSPFGLAVNPAGTKLYVAHQKGSKGIDVIDITNNYTKTNININSNSWGVAVTPDGTKVIVTAYTSNTPGTAYVINTTNNIITPVSVGTSPYGVAVSPDGSKVYVANSGSSNISIIDSSNKTVTATVRVGTNPSGVAVTPDGTKVYVANKGSGSVSIIDTASNVAVNVSGFNGPEGISINKEGTKVYVANNGNNTVSVMDTNTKTTIATVKVGSNPVAFGQFIVHPQ